MSYRKEWMKEYAKRQRKAALALLGNKCCKCGFADWRALQLDHKNGGGFKDVRSIARSRDVLRHPEKYQLLCANCNWIKKHEQKEHKGYLSVPLE